MRGEPTLHAHELTHLGEKIVGCIGNLDNLILGCVINCKKFNPL